MDTTKKLILVVDDEQDILDVLASSLDDLGYATLCTSHATEALRYVETHKVSLLLTDVVMPDMSGLELAKQATARQPQIKILVMTGFSPYPVGDHSVLHKPFRMADLAMGVRIALGEGRWT